MMWHLGVDEAGYGPNLGPLVMTLVGCQVPDEAPADLWRRLRPGVRGHADEPDHRPIVADSKLVYSAAAGMAELERAALAMHAAQPATLCSLVNDVASSCVADLCLEPWYDGNTALPTAATAEAIASTRELWKSTCATAGVTWGICRSTLFHPARFNDIVERWDSKGVVLSLGLVQLLQAAQELLPDSAFHVVIDKHGGRNHYAAALQQAFPDGFVRPLEEGRERSSYEVLGLGRWIRVTFQPRADAEHFNVALASIISKYLRELLMKEFNAYWQKYIPGLKPTAGYPLDARRYMDSIRPTLVQLGIEERTVWRQR